MAAKKHINKNWSRQAFENEVYDLFASAKNQLSTPDERAALINVVETAIERLHELGVEYHVTRAK